MSQPDLTPTFDPAQIPAIRGALLRYRVLGFVVGVLLVVLVLIGVVADRR